MYSESVRKLISGISTGDFIEVETTKGRFSGILMPRPDIGDENSLVLKLDNGYDIGINAKNIKSVRLVKKREKQTKEKIAKMEFDKSKPNVVLFVTGGTIASKIDYETGGVKALVDPEELSIPEIRKIVNISEIRSPFIRMSENMTPDDWLLLAKDVYKSIREGAKGIIIAHGTDTMHYTSAALSFFLRNVGIPVVLVGSQRSIDRPSSDAYMNLICSAYISASDIAEVGICMHATTNDDYCHFIRGTKARKMHSSRRDAFRPINDLPIAHIYPNGKIEKIGEYKKRSDTPGELDAKFDKKVALMKAYPGSDPSMMEHLIESGYHGIVIEGTGLGHVPTPWLEHIKSAIKDGIPVVVTTQTLYGRVNANVYSNLRLLYHDARAIPGEDMLPEVAYVKLGWVLAHTTDMDEIRKMMLTNYAGEITKRSDPRNFLW